MRPLILASASPRRRALLSAAGVPITCDPPDCDETHLEGETATAYVARVAKLKAQAVYEKRNGLEGVAQDAWILAADTTVWIPDPGLPMGKPADREEARAGLQELTQAGEHRVSTAFHVLEAATGKTVAAQYVSTRVWMRVPTPTELEIYLDTLEWKDKAGGYGIQGAAAGMITRLEGSYTNVVGLPLAEVLELLSRSE